MTLKPPSSSDNPRGQWSQLIARRAESLFTKPRPDTALAMLLGAERDDVRNWLAGKSLPDEVMHTGLMEALGLRNSVDDIVPKQLSGVEASLAMLRTQIESLYAGALQQDSWVTRNDKTPTARPPRPTEWSSAQRNAYKDHEALIGLRLHKGSAPYEELPYDKMVEILQNTKNAHEYARCYRISKGVIQNSVSLSLGSYNQIESGQRRVTPNALEKLQEPLFGPDTRAFDHFRNLSILNHQIIVNHCLAKDDEAAAVKEKEYMPPLYWQKSIEHFLHPERWESQPMKPEWQPEKIASQGQYMRALRRSMQLGSETIEAATGITYQMLHLLEYDKFEANEKRDDLIRYYQQESATRGLDLFDKAKMEQLPVGEVVLKPKAYWQAAIMRRVDPKRWEAVAEKPSWSAYLPQLDTQGKYFTAMRNSLGLTGLQLVEDMHISNKAIVTVELDRSELPTYAAAREKMISYFEKLQSQIARQEEALGIPPGKRTLLFDKAALESLPVTRLEKNTDRQR